MSEIDYMNECTARDLIVMLSEEYQIAPSEAMDIISKVLPTSMAILIRK